MAWLPLESNPDVMNKFLQKLGVSEKWNIVDVYGLDTDALAWVPQPVLSVILLFPCSEQYYKYSEAQRDDIKDKGQVVDPDVYYIKQVVSNACGTIALIHSVANNTDRISISDGPFKSLLDDSRNLSPEERGDMLQKTADQIIKVHQELAMEGQTEVNPNEQVNSHFVAFVHKGGFLYELDGRKEFPINHGATSPENLLQDAAKVCREYIAREPEDVNFTAMALTANVI